MARFDSRTRQEITNVYRRLPNSVLHLNYAKKTARATINGADQGILIFGSTFEHLAEFAYNEPECATKEIFARMQEKYPNM